MQAYHNSHSAEYRSPFGAVPVGTKLRLALKVAEPQPGLHCHVRLWQDGVGAQVLPMHCERWADTALFCAEITAPDAGCLLWYSFILEHYENRFFYGNNAEGLGGEGQAYESNPKTWQITVYQPEKAPDWYQQGIAYQIFPDRFFRGSDWLQRQAAALKPASWKGPRDLLQLDWNDTPHYVRNEKGEIARWTSFGGTLTGIREKLAYLKSLGVTVLYLNPIFEASSNHKYDTADYLRVDPALGDEESFQALVTAAAELDMHILLDGVFSHTGADSRYFNRLGNYGPGGACQDPNSPYASWYRFQSWPERYECWWGVTDLPNVNELDPAYLDFICTGENSVIRHWTALGIGGWRLDVADELPDAFIAAIRRAMEQTNPDTVLLGEVWEDASNKISYGERRRYFFGGELHSVMNYPFRDNGLAFLLGQISAELLCRRLLQQMENYPKECFYSNLNLIGSHDRERVLTALGEAPGNLSEKEQEGYRLPAAQRELARRRLKILSLMQFTLPGIPCIYYGDEAGLEGFRDPYNRGTYPWGQEDQDLLAHYRMLATLRQQYPVLATGDFQPLALGEDVYACRHWNQQQALYVLVNRSRECTRSLRLAFPAPWALELTGSQWVQAQDGCLELSLPPLGFLVLLPQQGRPLAAPRSRAAGVLCHLTAIPTQGSFPTLGDGYAFVDFLRQAGMQLWQVLPLNPVGLGGSPYYSPCAFAGDTRLIDRSREPDWAGLPAFREKHRWWLEDYGLFMALKEAHGGAAWYTWPDAERHRQNLAELRQRYAPQLEATCQEQYWFWSQWAELKAYAQAQGIVLIGDLPLGVSDDSADVWASPEYFCLDAQGRPGQTAGAPPDYFNPEGQNWGSPVYNWAKHAADGYAWWVRRLRHALEAFAFIRLDHFRGFSAYYAIPAGEDGTAGSWQPGPGMALMQALEAALGAPLPLLAEDLGSLDAGVYNLLRRTGLPGMDVYQFEREKMERATPEEAKARLYYTSTHDSQTLLGWFQAQGGGMPEAQACIAQLYASAADWVLLQLQDVLGLDDAARFNTPGTVGPHNWSWRCPPDCLTEALAQKFAKLAAETGRT